MKNFPVGAPSRSMRTDGQHRQTDEWPDTNKTKLTVAFRGFANAPKNHFELNTRRLKRNLR